MSGQSRGTGAIIAAAVLALCLPAAFIVGLTKLGVPILPSGAAVAAEAADEAPVAPLAVLAESPATRVLGQLLTEGPGSPWSPSSPATWAVGTPYDYACDLASAGLPGAAASAQRAFTDGTSTVTVTLRAYGAGAGPVAFDDLRARVDGCPQRDASVSTGRMALPDTEAVTGEVRPVGFPRPVTTIAWHRGDVLIDVHATGLPFERLAAAASSLDMRVLGALSGVCADLRATADDAVRSPWIDRQRYRGLLVPEPVSVAPVPAPTPPAGVAPRDPAVRLDPLPTVTLPTTQPAEPLWPLLPKPVAPPATPAPVSPQPTATEVLVPRRDETGPGCGWAFTAQVPPPFDADAATVARTAAIADAKAALVAAQQQWQVQLLRYWKDAAAYEAGIGAYRLYAEKVARVSEAWVLLQQARDAYASALATWNADNANRAAFVAQQQQAAIDYQAAIDACAAIPPPEPTPEPTPTPDPFATGTPTPAPSPALPPGCPPQRPEILDQTLPPAPPAPTPPPDPRPSATATGR